MKPLSVTELNSQIKNLLEPHFFDVAVEGEVSKAVYHSSGHLYFTIKDENSAINCAMWRNSVAKMKFRIKPGDKILIVGKISVYTPRGEYRVIATSIEPSGIGALQRAYEELKKELIAKGYFDASNKKPLPKFPKRVAIITSLTGAAIEDMLRIARNRWGLAKFYLIDALVQGEGAAKDIAKKIELADGMGFDVIVIGRGGGSVEDLWAFNERVVADAVFRAKTPIISAVGHEIDYLISDFVADKRASTPSNAMEILLPDKNEVLMFLDEKEEQLRDALRRVFDKKIKELNHLKEMLRLKSPLNAIETNLKNVAELRSELNLSLNRLFFKKQKELNNLKEILTLNSPLNKIYKTQQEIKDLKNELDNSLKRVFLAKYKELDNLRRNLTLLSPLKKINSTSKEIEFLKEHLKNKTSSILREKQRELDSLKEIYSSFKPKKEIELLKDNRPVKIEELKVGDRFEIHSLKRVVEVEVKRIKE